MPVHSATVSAISRSVTMGSRWTLCGVLGLASGFFSLKLFELLLELLRRLGVGVLAAPFY
jgi:hypothetical protein